MRLNGVEPSRVLHEEGLHVGDLKKTVIIAGHAVIPDHCAAFLNGSFDHVHLDDVIADFLHQCCQDTLVDARENFRIYQILNGQLTEALRQPSLIFNVPGNFVELHIILAMEPVRDKVIAIGLMRCRDKGIQPGQVILMHCPRCCGQQHMDSKSSKVGVITVAVSGSLRDHYPKWLVCAIGQEALINAVRIQIQSSVDNSLDNLVRLNVVAASKCCHNSKVHLRSRGNAATEFLDNIPAILCPEELPVMLHLITDNRRSR